MGAEAVSNRGPSAYQPTALPLGQTGSLLIIISSVHFYCHLHSHWTCPCGACTGMVKASTGTGLLILFLYRPWLGMVRVSLPSRVCFQCVCVCVCVCACACVCVLMKDSIGRHSYCHGVTLNILSSVYIFQHTVTRLLLNLEDTSHFFGMGSIFLWSKQQGVTLTK